MTYSYTQISQYLSCPRRYKHRYLEGWKEKDMRAAMMFGRASSRLWLPTSSGRMRLWRSTENGTPTGRAVFTIPSGTVGTECCNRGCNYLIASPRTTVFVFGNLDATCK